MLSLLPKLLFLIAACGAACTLYRAWIVALPCIGALRKELGHAPTATGITSTMLATPRLPVIIVSLPQPRLRFDMMSETLGRIKPVFAANPARLQMA